MKRTSLSLLFLLSLTWGWAQDDLMDILSENESKDDGVVTATFKSTRLINGHTVETRTKNLLEFIIMHRFGTIDNGFYDLFGLDYASIRFGLEYGITDNLNVGFGRASFNKTYDGYVKCKILKQSSSMPVTITAFADATVISDEFFDDRVGANYQGAHRWSYAYQVLIARKMGDLSLQLMPTLVHRNWVETAAEPNDLIAIGVGGRYKLTNRLTLNMEWFPTLNQDSEDYYDAVAVGVDIETGGHVFQLHMTNAQQMNEPGFVGYTTDNFWKLEIHLGFNISRVFNLGAGHHY